MIDTSAPRIDQLVAFCAAVRDRETRVCWIEVPFADGAYRFHLGRKEVEELERSCSYQNKAGDFVPLGVGAIFSRVAKGRAFLPSGEVDWSNISEGEILASEITQRDCVETIRLGLIGGGRGVVNGESVTVSALRAKQLVDTYVIGQPIEDAWHYAFATLGALIYGVAAPAEPMSELE